MKPANCFDPNRFTVIQLENEYVKPMIVEKHYLHRWPTKPQWCYGIVRDKSRLVGAIVFGGPNRHNIASSISPLITDIQVTELLRLFIENGCGNGLASWSIAQAFKHLRTEAPYKIVVVSYADPSAGHTGTIYQATNGTYQVMPHANTTFQVNLTDPNNPAKWIHSRTQQRLFGIHNLDALKRKIGRTFWIRRDSKKYRYLWFLTDTRQKKHLVESLYYPPATYPKETLKASDIEVITITE